MLNHQVKIKTERQGIHLSRSLAILVINLNLEIIIYLSKMRKYLIVLSSLTIEVNVFFINI